MRKLIALAVLGLAAVSMTAQAADATCEAKATEKKLAGAAKNSFMKKCEKDAAAAGAGEACTTAAGEKKLAGAAKASFMKKCVREGGPAKG
jgi:hypothetical protein